MNEALQVDEMTEKEVHLEDVTIEREVLPKEEMIVKDRHLDAVRLLQQDPLDRSDLFTPISNMAKVEVHHEQEVDHQIDIHLDPSDHTRNLRVQAEDRNHLTENDQEKQKIMDNSVIVPFHHLVICTR